MWLPPLSMWETETYLLQRLQLTFLLQEFLGGNARTAVVANIHPGSRWFGKTLAILNFPKRAKLIKNKAEDTQVYVSQVEVKRFKEHPAQLLSGQILPESFLAEEKDETDYLKYSQDFHENL